MNFILIDHLHYQNNLEKYFSIWFRLKTFWHPRNFLQIEIGDWCIAKFLPVQIQYLLDQILNFLKWWIILWPRISINIQNLKYSIHRFFKIQWVSSCSNIGALLHRTTARSHVDFQIKIIITSQTYLPIYAYIYWENFPR